MYIFASMKANFLITFLICSCLCSAQTLITEVCPFQNDPQKFYSAYIPTSYDANEPNKAIIGFHPFNTSRWDAESWRDTLVTFAESVHAILICPDGGADGKVDDNIDTAFTRVILEKMKSQYNIDEDQLYLCGFSWGGRAAYKYGLHRPGMFQGNLITGAAVNGTNEVNGVLPNAAGENYYLIHGSNDNLNTRHTIISNALIDRDACVESNILQGVGHTIDYPNRNQILKDGFDYLVENNCLTSHIKLVNKAKEISIFPNPSRGSIQFRTEIEELQIEKIFDANGSQVAFEQFGDKLNIFNLFPGLYILHFKAEDGKRYSKRIILD